MFFIVITLFYTYYDTKLITRCLELVFQIVNGFSSPQFGVPVKICLVGRLDPVRC